MKRTHWEQGLADGAALHEAGRLPDAEARLRQVLREAAAAGQARPVPALIRLAGVLLDRGEGERAYAIADEAVACDPDNPLALNLRGSALGTVGRRVEAEAAFRAAIDRDANFVEAWCNLGRLLASMGRQPEAVVALRAALALAPAFHAARRALSSALRDEGHFAEAMTELEQVIAVEGETPELLNDLGILLTMSRRGGDAVRAFDAAVAARPDHVAALFNRSVALLQQGDFGRGWPEYEHRFRTAMVRPIPFDRPRWRGEAIAGKTVVLWGEQGHGDTLQFVRYAPLVAARGARVVVIAQPALVDLLRSVPGVERVVAPGQAVGPHDLHAPLMGLPEVFGTTVDTIPAAIPYLQPDVERRARWAGRIGPPGRAKVGLVWAGDPRPHMPMSNATDRRRSLRPGALAPLLEVEAVDFVSLQFGARGLAGDGSARIEWVRGDGGRKARQLLDPMGEVRDFADTAAIVEQLDLVVTVDTAVAHLAGALGRPVWVMSRYDACFRWLLDRDDSPWYPTLRLFRQSTPGDWQGVVARVAAELRARWATA